MYKKIGALALAATLLLCSTALGASGPYLRGHLGGSLVNDISLSDQSGSADIELEPGFHLGAALGFDWGAARLEAELAYAQSDVDKAEISGSAIRGSGDISALSLLFNGYLDLGSFHFLSGAAAAGQQTPVLSLTPFVGAGIGVASLTIDENQIGAESEDDTVVAGQLGAGVGLALNEFLSLDLSYRFFITEEPNFDGVDAEYNAHNLLVGLRYDF